MKHTYKELADMFLNHKLKRHPDSCITGMNYLPQAKPLCGNALPPRQQYILDCYICRNAYALRDVVDEFTTMTDDEILNYIGNQQATI